MKKILSIVFCVIFVLILVGCKEELPAQVSEIQIKDDLIESLTKMNYSVEDLTKFEYISVPASDADMEKLKSSFTSPVPYQIVNISFESESLSQNLKGEYAIIYAYTNNSWIIVQGNKIDEDSWSYVAKEKVSNTVILKQIKDLTFPNFNKGEIGDDKTTSIEIASRSTDLELGTDKLSLSIKYDAGFAIYEMGTVLDYVFKDGIWVLSQSSIDKEEFWKVEYKQECLPEPPQDNYIISTLTNNSIYKTYTMNLAYVDNYYLTRGETLSKAKQLTYNYILIVSYENFGDFEYDVSKEYVWDQNNWIDGELTCTFKEANLSKMIGTWASTNGSFVTFNTTDNTTLHGTYTHKYADESYIVYEINGNIEVGTDDNFWTMSMEQLSVVSGKEIEKIVILPFKLNFESKTISSNGNIFVSAPSDGSGIGFVAENAGTIDGSGQNPFEIGQTTEPPTTDNYNSGLTFFDDTVDTSVPSETSAPVSSSSPSETTAFTISNIQIN